jgi:hypothetical protein
MVLEDSQTIQITFGCCSRQRRFPLSHIKNSISRGFYCPYLDCGASVTYAPQDFAQLIKKSPEDAPFEITFHRL